MNIFKSLGRSSSFRSNNAESWQKRDVELFFERIGLGPLTDSVFGKNNPLLSTIDSGEKLLSSFQTIRSNADAMLEARNSCASLYDPYSIYDTGSSNSENSQMDPKTTELQGLIGLFLQPSSSSGGRSGSVISSSVPPQQNSSNLRGTGKFDNLPIHSIVKQRLQNLDQLLKLKKSYEMDRKQDPNNDDASSSPSQEMGKKFDPEDENDFFMFQQNFIMDHLIASQFFRLEPKNGTSKTNASLYRINVNAMSESISFNENLTFNDLRKLYIQLNNLYENANHFNESFIEFEKNKGSKPLFYTSSEKGGMFESTASFESVEFGFIGNDVDCRLLTTKQVIEFLRYKKIDHNCLKKVIEDNYIDGQIFSTLRHPLEWMVLLFPSRNEIAEKGTRKNSPKPHPYQALYSLALAISNIIRVICSNKYLLGGELKELKDFHL
ncbi:hypothetical protein FDP41_002581 [Naegleria fowleri]|uniref:Uncharacterized protein n=1 Tax=Naegleria fowleri TaxID=5763 RepID=A0A6A5BSC4_NAEFO|nr:uncharacterized protein FDP41_002581 [Naegleria fowleri]KAF0978066.1 hypothetical protein FDP41_002581 [Naegleria fowleri]CAG4710803.1 unnamed protein product [Naegleria fowleri]